MPENKRTIEKKLRNVAERKIGRYLMMLLLGLFLLGVLLGNPDDIRAVHQTLGQSEASEKLKKLPIPLAQAILATVLVVWAVFTYLAPGATEPTEQDSQNKIRELETEIDSLSRRVSVISTTVATPTTSTNVSDENLRDNLKERLKAVTTKDFAEEFLELARKEIRADQHREDTFSPSTQSSERLSAEIRALAKRGNINLVLGMVTTMMGLYVLGEFVSSNSAKTWTFESFGVQFFPRVALVIFLQVFAYFFLRLYKQSLDEIKYYQNELTNIAARRQALACALQSGSATLIEEVVLKIAATERNTLLSKGQTTIEIERAKLDKDETTALAAQLASLLKAKTGEKGSA